MSGDSTIDAIRLALGMQELQARVASTNIANAGRPNAQALRIDFADAQRALEDAANETAGSSRLASRLRDEEASLGMISPVPTAEAVNLDGQVADMVAASTSYQTLSEALSRQFGLMRLAISGRS
jgi:flagellar basal body rod protein FlgB